MIRLADYSQLKLIAWNVFEQTEIDEADALALYERNWRFVDEAAMDERERALLERLVRDYGNGILHV